MKLLRYGEPGAEKPGMLDHNGHIRDLSGIIPDFGPSTLADESLDKLRKLDPSSLPTVDGDPRIGPCVTNVGKFMCIGLNFADHAAETGSPIPKEPVLFMKATSAIIGPNDTVVIPKDSTKTDWEVELGVVIGKKAQHVSEADALSHVAGFCVINDVSERAFQTEGTGQWTKGKSCDTFGPIGPWLVTRDEVADPQNLKMWTDVDGTRMQDGSSKTMIFSVAHCISFLSKFFTLHPGDIISTGTPPGVGAGKKPNPIFLKPGQVMKVGVEGLGEQTQKVAAYEG